jgi:hypothetical protein
MLMKMAIAAQLPSLQALPYTGAITARIEYVLEPEPRFHDTQMRIFCKRRRECCDGRRQTVVRPARIRSVSAGPLRIGMLGRVSKFLWY